MRLLGVFTAIVLAAGCNSSSTPGQTAAGSPSCAPGWWVESTSSPCTCSSTSAPPECKDTDCEQLGFEGFVDSQTVIDGVLDYSQTAGTISSVAPSVERAYSVQGSTITIAGAQGGPLTCSGDHLGTAYYSKVRAPAEIVAGLTRAYSDASATFVGVPTR